MSKEISVLPSRQVLVASQVALLEGEKKITLSNQKLPGQTTLKSSSLAIEPNLIVSVLGALPRLATPSTLCLDALLNRYVPLAAVTKLFEDFPEIRKVGDAIRQQKGPRQAWDLKDPRRLISVLESPWALEAEGVSSSVGADLLDPKVVSELAASTQQAIPTFQREDGSFTWFPGGPSDLYMTLTALSTFVEGEDFGISFKSTPPPTL